VTRAFTALMVILAVALARPAIAKPRPIVQVFIAAAPSERSALEQVLRELLEPLAIDLRFTPRTRIERRSVDGAADARAGVAAIAFVDALEAGRSTLYLVDPVRDRVYVRSVPRPRHGEELAREELGHILETALEGLLVGETIGVPRHTAFPPSRPHQPTTTPQQPEWRPSLGLGLLYEAQYLSHEVLLTHGPVVAGELVFRRRTLGLGVWASAQYRQPLHAESALVSARLEGASLRLLATLGAEVASRLELRTGLGGGVDIVDVEPRTRDASRAEATDDRVLSYAVFRAVAGVGWRLSSSLSLVAWIAADLDPSNTRYVFSTARGEDTVLAPSAVRPAVLLGLALD
jgi:hypothetical protein